jgi:hypothetical protein
MTRTMPVITVGVPHSHSCLAVHLDAAAQRVADLIFGLSAPKGVTIRHCRSSTPLSADAATVHPACHNNTFRFGYTRFCGHPS